MRGCPAWDWTGVAFCQQRQGDAGSVFFFPQGTIRTQLLLRLTSLSAFPLPQCMSLDAKRTERSMELPL